MATTRGKKRSEFQVRTVRTKEDRKRPSVFMSLKEDEAFKGVALFEPDPEIEDNPGYYEYFSHWDQQGNTYVPCAGDKCPFCAANDNPSTQALTVWYFPNAGDKKDQIKVFTMNYSTTQEASDESEDEGGILGKVVRIKRLSKKGDYRFKVTADKPLTKVELKKVMGMLEEKFQDGLDGLVNSQLKRQMERISAMEALEDDDEDDQDDDTQDDDEEEEEEAPKARRGRKQQDEEEEEDDDEDEDESSDEPVAIEDEELEILSVRKKDGYLVVELGGEEVQLYASDDAGIDDFKKGQTVTVSADWELEDEDDEDTGYYLLTPIEEATEEDEAEEEEDEDSDDDSEDEGESTGETEIKGRVYEVVKVQEKDEILEVKDEDGEKVKMWVGEGVEPDYEEVKRGVKIKVDAEQDEEEDWIIVALELVPDRKATARKTTGARRSKR